MFGVFGFVLNPIHCIQIEFILIGRFKRRKKFCMLEKRWKTDVVKKSKENTNLMTGRCHLFRVGKHKNKASNICFLVLHSLSISKYSKVFRLRY